VNMIKYLPKREQSDTYVGILWLSVVDN